MLGKSENSENSIFNDITLLYSLFRIRSFEKPAHLKYARLIGAVETPCSCIILNLHTNTPAGTFELLNTFTEGGARHRNIFQGRFNAPLSLKKHFTQMTFLIEQISFFLHYKIIKYVFIHTIIKFALKILQETMYMLY